MIGVSKMKLRKLEKKDAENMLEWMHDPSVVENLQTDFSKKTLDDCLHFIECVASDEESIHRAIVDVEDEYLGTVSLKNIKGETAEFAITIRKCAMGKGISKWAMSEIIEYGFNFANIKTVYWCVNPINTRAVRFYDKNQYRRIRIDESDLMRVIKEAGYYTSEQVEHYIWYSQDVAM